MRPILDWSAPVPDGIVIGLPCLIKAKKSGDKRIVEVEASNEFADSEGDIILQKALLDSADYFIKSGNIDIDHLSELGHRLGIPDPTSYVIGRPTEVKDLGEGRTGVIGEIRRSADGKVDTAKNKYDEFWESLQTSPPVTWLASIYGFPKSDQVVDCRTGTCADGATRFLVKGIEWRSLAMTRNPINTSLKGHARIVSAKSFAAALKSYGTVLPSPAAIEWKFPPRSCDELWGQYQRHISKDCPSAGPDGKSRACFKDHFTYCCGLDSDSAELLSNALMMMVLDDQKKKSD